MHGTKPDTATYVRKSPRIAFEAGVLATNADGNVREGRFVDLSSGGACIELPYRAERGEEIRLYLERKGKSRGTWSGASVVGLVAWCVPAVVDSVECDGFDFEIEGTGSGDRRRWHRIGIALKPSAVTERWLAELEAPAEYTAEEEPALPRHKGRGRTEEERASLRADALGFLATGEHERARAAVRTALAGAPRAPELRGLLLRIDAEEALVRQRYDVAHRRIAQGRKLAGDEPCWDELERAVRSRSRGLLARLFG
jgi:hypothetical protein